MIANARMYSVSPQAATAWRTLFSALLEAAGTTLSWLDHAEPDPIEDLWLRPDQGAVFMCGLPFSLAAPQPLLLAAPVPSPVAYGGQPRYWSRLVVRGSASHQTVADTFGGRLALTVPGSQSGCWAALSYLQSLDDSLSKGRGTPLFREIIAPTTTPMGALNAVLLGKADIAPIDSYAFDLMTRYRPQLTDQVRVVADTQPTPIPPLVTHLPSDHALHSLLPHAHRIDSITPLLDALLIERFAQPPASDYDDLRNRRVAATEYWRSHQLAGVTHPAFVLSGNTGLTDRLAVK